MSLLLLEATATAATSSSSKQGRDETPPGWQTVGSPKGDSSLLLLHTPKARPGAKEEEAHDWILVVLFDSHCC